VAIHNGLLSIDLSVRIAAYLSTKEQTFPGDSMGTRETLPGHHALDWSGKTRGLRVQHRALVKGAGEIPALARNSEFGSLMNVIGCGLSGK